MEPLKKFEIEALAKSFYNIDDYDNEIPLYHEKIAAYVNGYAQAQNTWMAIQLEQLKVDNARLAKHMEKPV